MRFARASSPVEQGEACRIGPARAGRGQLQHFADGVLQFSQAVEMIVEGGSVIAFFDRNRRRPVGRGGLGLAQEVAVGLDLLEQQLSQFECGTLPAGVCCCVARAGRLRHAVDQLCGQRVDRI